MSTGDENLRSIYEEVCRAHDGISEFRAKLLALLPFASGAGIFLLLQDNLPIVHLPAVGCFGALITLGLYFFELRGLQRCLVLHRCGMNVEAELLGNASGLGTFTDEPQVLGLKVVGSANAVKIVYSPVLAAWVYVAVSEVFPLETSVWITAATLMAGLVLGTACFAHHHSLLRAAGTYEIKGIGSLGKDLAGTNLASQKRRTEAIPLDAE